MAGRVVPPFFMGRADFSRAVVTPGTLDRGRYAAVVSIFADPSIRYGRRSWHVDPLTGAGPLRFGMNHHAAAEAFDDTSAYSAAEARTGFECGLHAFYDDEDRLSALLFDPQHGPQPVLDGTPLAGLAPRGMARVLDDHTTARGLGPVIVGPYDDAAHPGLGLALNPDACGDVVLTRPVLVSAQWADRLVPAGGGPEVPQWRRLSPLLLHGDGGTGERVDWEFEPRKRVGPLDFGMNAERVIAVLGEASVSDRRPADPAEPAAGAWIRFADPAVTTFFDEHGRLAAVVADAARGPQLQLAGIRLTGEVPSTVTAALERHLRAAGHEIVTDCTGCVMSPADGLVHQGQRIGDDLRTRPLLLSGEWAGGLSGWRSFPFLADEVLGVRRPIR